MTSAVKKISLELPTLYGDHHVTEVRRILFNLPGVEDVYASSAFHMVEVSYDPEKVNDLEISLKLDEAGYLGEWTVMTEPSEAESWQSNGKKGFRHTAAYEQTREMVTFGHQVSYTGRPLWSCPGMGAVKKMED